jgi:hypothetical protein
MVTLLGNCIRRWLDIVGHFLLPSGVTARLDLAQVVHKCNTKLTSSQATYRQHITAGI